jgi:hypothetical protein
MTARPGCSSEVSAMSEKSCMRLVMAVKPGTRRRHCLCAARPLAAPHPRPNPPPLLCAIRRARRRHAADAPPEGHPSGASGTPLSTGAGAALACCCRHEQPAERAAARSRVWSAQNCGG